MKLLIVFALAFATVWAKDLYSRSIEIPVLKNKGRIANGENASPGQFPYQVGINNRQGQIFVWCGGSLIAKDFILTSAHCMVGTLWAKVYLGATERLVAEQSYKVLRSDMTMHPYWNSDTLRNNIGLMRIPITSETGTIRIVRIPKNDYVNYVGELAVIAGWGQTTDDSPVLSNNLKYVTLRVTSGFDCSNAFPNHYYNDISLCVATPDMKSPCPRDYGGPLVLEGENLQIGLFSFNSQKGCEFGIPAVFVRLGPYVKWIRSYID